LFKQNYQIKHKPRDLAGPASRITVPLILTLCLSLFIYAGCSSQGGTPNDLTVSAAVSLKDAFNEIAMLYSQRTKTTVHFNFGASGSLEKQIEAGALVDVFASAGSSQMDALVARHLIVSSSKRDFARNALVLIIPKTGTSSISSLADLAKGSVTKIAIGNPRTVPAGQYSEQTLTRLGLLPAVQARLIFAEDVRQVLNYVARGEVDAGLVYLSDAASAVDKVTVIARVPEDAHDPILYPIGILSSSQQQDRAGEFVELVTGPEGQAILQKHGFLPIK
jgi:molybdate transport system substrate-binding protein